MWVENFELGVTNLTPEFLKMNPIGKIPVLETPDGFVFESNAIARYVARLKTDTSLFGSSPIEYAKSNNGLISPLSRLIQIC
ncbi:hypothetical protein L1987_54951 [Smallanthus sonchifolius]|uniref:Uncharacterized protein n=1 Tax=Smallanthus sonchifolius TaxID=185202 RepID=A0ACB9E9M5_9ASTR|nr:hypothetical protein L1987_54951 [Smallanthus sonchifolius]